MSAPGRSRIESWNLDQLALAGNQYADLAEKLRTTLDEVSRIVHLPGDNGEWEGDARRAAEDRVTSEVSEVRKLSAAVDDLATALSEGGASVGDLVRRLLSDARWAEEERFVVSDDWSVTDSVPEADDDRLNTMANWQASISGTASALAGTLDTVAQRIRSALDEIEMTAPVSSARLPAGFQLDTSGLSPSRQRAVEYAEQHWKRYNPAYPNYADQGSDCANFVSQVLEAGGFEQSISRDTFNDPNDSDPNAWFSQPDENLLTEDWEASRTWTYAPSLHEYLTGDGGNPADGTPSGIEVSTASWESPDAPMDPTALSKSGLQPGDVIFYEKTLPDGTTKISHTAVYVGQDWITQPDGSRVWGDVVNMHTSDRYHEPWYLPRYGEDSGNFPITYHPVKVDYPDDPS